MNHANHEVGGVLISGLRRRVPLLQLRNFASDPGLPDQKRTIAAIREALEQAKARKGRVSFVHWLGATERARADHVDAPDVKPILLPLVECKRSARSLTAQETRIIARWAFKTAFMVLSGQQTNPVPWQMFETWAAAGAGDPDPAVIFALSDLQSTRGFGYVNESDDLEIRRFIRSI
jgi:hypothetical protein